MSAKCGSITLHLGLSYTVSGAQRLRTSIRRCWMELLGRSSWFLGAEVGVLGMILGAAVPGDALLGC
jgi:hypothetical protein